MANHVMVFAFDPACEDLQDASIYVENEDAAIVAGSVSTPSSSRRQPWRYEVDWEDAGPLEKQVRAALSSLEPDAHFSKDGTGADGSTPRQSQRPNLDLLCALLRQRGLHPQLVLPTPSGGVRCGRCSTGGGGQCVAAAGRVCYFCSRQPYVVVSAPLKSDASPPPCDGSGGAGVVPPVMACGSERPAGQVLVEPSLREIFRVAPQTPEYAAAVAALPEVWVGPRGALLALASKMCDAMALNFRCQGLDIPPWRRRASILGRWAAAPTQALPQCSGLCLLRVMPAAPRDPSGGDQVADSGSRRDGVALPPPATAHREPSVASTRTVHPRTPNLGCGAAGAALTVNAATAAAGALDGAGGAWPMAGSFAPAPELHLPPPQPARAGNPLRAAGAGDEGGEAARATEGEAEVMAVSIGDTIAPVQPPQLRRSGDAEQLGRAAVTGWVAAAAPPLLVPTRSAASVPAVVVYGFDLPSPAIAG